MQNPLPCYEFGDFLLDVGQQRLSRRDGSDPVGLTGKPFDMLVYLIEHAGEVLDQETLLAAVWPGVTVDENSLTQVISTLRQLLGEARGEHHYIATLPRKGYRFVAQVGARDVSEVLRRYELWILAAAILLCAVAIALFVVGKAADVPDQDQAGHALAAEPLLARFRGDGRFMAVMARIRNP